MNKKSKRILQAIKRSHQKQVFNCQHKKRYSSPASAIAAAMYSEENMGNTKCALFYYKCTMCSGYHLTRKAGGDSIVAI